MKKIFIGRPCLVLACLLCLVSFTPLCAQTDFDYIPGQYSLGSLGGATYTIPIECPEGLNGVQPQLSLVFNSQSGEGSCGFNWSLSGISAISRVPATIFSDNRASGITFTVNDCYALDGNRLIVHPQGDRYVTETETWQLIQPWGEIRENGVNTGPQWFQVTTKDGHVLQYGNTAASRFIPDRSNHSAPYMWLINRMEDQNGNYIEYDYDTGSGAVKLYKITYGNTYSDKYYDLVFAAETRTDRIESVIAGRKLVNDFVYKTIYVESDNITLYTYKLTYDIYTTPGGRKEYRLSRVDKQTGSNPATPTTVIWHSNNYRLNDIGYRVSFTHNDQNLWDYSFIANDVNGDGKDELLALQTYNNTTYLEPLYPRDNGNGQIWYGPDSKIFNLGASVKYDKKGKNEFYNKGMNLADVNGDGIKEFITTYAMKVNGKLSMRFVICDKDHMYVKAFPMITSQSSPAYVCADFNNDGVEDLLFIEDTPKNGTYPARLIYFSKGALDSTPYTEISFTVNVPEDPRIIYASDFDNDGLTDLLVVTEHDCHFFKNYGGGKNASGKVTVSFAPFSMSGNIHFTSWFSVIRPGDFNGDGLMDFLLNERSVPVWYLAVNNGKFGFDRIDLPHFTAWEEANAKGNDAREDCVIIDFNHDGLSDVVLLDAIYNGNDYQKSKLSWYKSVGDNLEKYCETELQNVNYAFGGLNCTGDFDGDGRQELFSYHSDLYAYNTDGDSHIISCPDTDFNQGKVTSIREGAGKITHLEYRPLTYSKLDDGSSFYTKSAAASSYVYYAQPPLHCTRRCRITDANRTYSDTYYTYADLAIGMEGKGVHGFGSTTAADQVAGRKSVSTVTWDASWIYPRTTTQLVSTLSGKGISSQATILDMSHGANYVIRPSTEKTTDLIMNWSSLTQYNNYDEAGNPTEVTTIRGSHREKKLFEYVQKGSWCKNKVSKQTVIQSKDKEEHTRYTAFDYDEKGNLIKETRDPSHRNKLVTQYLDFNVYGLPQKITVTGNGVTRTSTTAYTASGRFPARKTNELGETTYYDWEETAGLLRSQRDVSGTTVYYYDSFRRLKKTVYPSGLTEEAGLYASVGGAPAYAAYYTYSHTHGQSPLTTWYDCMGRELRTQHYGIGSALIHTDTEYNDAGQLYRVSDPHFANASFLWNQTYTYDDYGRPLTVKRSVGTETYTYNGNTTTVVSSTIGTKSTTVNILGQTLKEVTNGKSVEYVYDAAGRLVSATPQGGEPVTMVYDLQGNRIVLNDPDAGRISYVYNAFGQIQIEAQRVHIYAYPNAASPAASPEEGVAPSDEDPGISPRWGDPIDPLTIESYYEYNSKGLLTKVSYQSNCYTSYSYDSRNRISGVSTHWYRNVVDQSYTYDNYDRLIEETKVVDGKALSSALEYDTYGRVSKKTYPSGYYVSYDYDANGYLDHVNGQPIYMGGSFYTPQAYINLRTAKGELVSMSKGEKAVSYTFNPSVGLPSHIYTPGVNNLRYGLTTKGFISSRVDNSTGQRESFTYDEHRRLVSWAPQKLSASSSQPYQITYDASTGNIVGKSDVGDYAFEYGSNLGAPHALSAIKGKSPLIPSTSASIEYTDFKKVKRIIQGQDTLSLIYGADWERACEVFRSGANKLTRYFMDDYEEEVDRDGRRTRQIHYLWADEELLGVYISNLIVGDLVSSQINEFYYASTDHQGSLLALYAPDGAIAERYAYDPWGRRRDPLDWTKPDTRKTFLVSRGYTLHEHLDAFGLINMNGRVYDPVLGMFLSPDPYIQEPGNWLNYNRYTYCLNNPLLYTDPSGELFGLDDMLIIMFASAATNAAFQMGSGHVNGIGDFFASIGIGALSGAGGYIGGNLLSSAGFLSGAINGFAGGFAGGFISGTGNSWFAGASFGQGLKSGLICGGVGGGIGALTSGLASGAFAKSNGGNFWTGKGTTVVNEFIGNEDVLGGDYFKDDDSMQKYINSKNGWKKGKYHIADITVEGTPEGVYNEKAYYRDEGIIMRTNKGFFGTPSQVAGVTTRTQTGIFNTSSTIYMSPHVSIKEFTATLNHEMIHAYHNSIPFLSQRMGAGFHNATEQSAHRYSSLFAPSVGSRLNGFIGMKTYPSLYRLGWPKYLISF